MRGLYLLGIVGVIGVASPVTAQIPTNRPIEDEMQQLPSPSTSTPEVVMRTGQTADTGTGQVGQRQTREQVAQAAGVEPTGRIDGRIQNRVQARIRNRIDRYYDPQANAIAPFTVAGAQLRTTARARR